MTEYHISDTARGTILRELANRMQKQVSDVTSPWYVGSDRLAWIRDLISLGPT